MHNSTGHGSDTKPNVIHETIVRLGEQRGAPRYFVNARYLANAGFEHGQWLSVHIGDGTLTLRPVEEPTGKRVQEKNGQPLIDLNAKFLAQVFGESKELHVRVTEREVVLSIHRFSERAAERPRDRSSASLFAGAGLLDESAIAAGFTPKWAVELDRSVADVFSENHPSAAMYEMSVHEAAFTPLSPVELLLVGLPCQPWARCRTLNSDGSKVDKSRPATEHPLGDMAFWTLLVIARVNPRTVVLECAPAFGQGELCASLTGALRRLGYEASSRVLNAHDFGSLSKRRRTVLVATTADTNSSAVDPWPVPTSQESTRPTVASVLDADPDPALWWDRDSKPWVFRVNEMNAARGNGFGFQICRPEDTQIATLTAQYGETKNDQPVLAHPAKPDTYRYFTVAEGRRIFGLRDSFILPPAKTFAWRLLGQAVFIPMFAEIIRRATARGLPAAHPGLIDQLPLFSATA